LLNVAAVIEAATAGYAPQRHPRAGNVSAQQQVRGERRIDHQGLRYLVGVGLPAGS